MIMSTTVERSRQTAGPGGDEGRLVLADVSWDQYEKLLDLFSDRRLRLTYDRGTLEIMSPSSLHEWYKELLANLVRSLAAGLKVDYVSFGSMRCKSELLARGVEPDACFLIGSYRPDRKWREYEIAVDPPPDLVVEIDLTSGSKVRLATYAALKVPEVWRFDGSDLTVLVLRDGAYVPVDRSPAFPLAPIERLESFVRDFEDGSERVWMDGIRAWAASLPKVDG
jgi:Uma2 family endonuclease